jgi:hypothetical protein
MRNAANVARQPKGTSPSGLRGPKESNEGNRGLNLIWTSSLPSFFSVDLILQRNVGILIFCFLICPGQNQSEDAVLEKRLMKVDAESFRGFATAFGRVLASLWEVVVRLKAMRGRHRTPKTLRAKMPLNPFVFFVSFC